MSMIKGFFKLILFFMLVGILMLYCSAVLRPKKTDLPNDTTNKVKGFYELEENSLDVLFLGTSHAYYGFNPGIVYHDTGLSSYVFAGECQPMSVTYYYLKEAIKTQNPKLIVLDVFSALPSSYGCQTEGIIKKNVEDFRTSLNKVEALKLLGDNLLIENVLDAAVYHDRWDELEKFELFYPLESHFNPSFGYTEGWPYVVRLYEREMFFSNETEIPDPTILNYVHLIYEIAEEIGSEVLLVKTPYYETYDEYKITNYLFQDAQSRGYRTINFNQYYNELDILFDREGDYWHCNVRGAWKITSMLSQFILDNYDIQISSDFYRKEYEHLYTRSIGTLLYSQNDPVEYLKYLKNLDVTLFVHYQKEGNHVLSNEQMQLFNDLGINMKNLNQNFFIVVNQDGEELYRQNESGFKYVFDTGKSSLIVEGIDGVPNYRYEDSSFNLHYNGINILVLDNVSGAPIDILCFDTFGYFQILR